MKQKFKRYFVIFPLVFTLLLSCVPMLGAHADSSDYFLSPEDLPQFFDNYDKDSLCDILDDFEEQKNGYLFSNGKSSDFFDYYFYCVHLDHDSYPSYLSGNTVKLRVDFVFFNPDQITPLFEDDNCITYQLSDRDILSFATNSTSSIFDATSSIKSSSSSHNNYLVYNKLIGQYILSTVYSESYNPKGSGYHYIYCQETNIPDFPITEGISHGSNGSLNVDVRFRPGLSGQVDRMLDNGDGTKSMVSQMRMTVVNNSRFPIQYKMYIMKKHRSTSRGGNLGAQHVNEKYDDDPVFIYYSNEWVYSNSLDNSSDWYNGHIQKQNKSTEWHYVSAGGSVAVLFNYSQIKLVENEEYTCIVEAVRNDYDCSSRMFVYHSTSEAAYLEYKQIWGDDKATVYQSDFSMLHYSDIKYDPNDTSNGVNPYGSYGDSLSYEWGYNAVDEGNGNVDYNSKNLFKDKNSWYNTQYNPNGIVVPGSYSSSGSSSFDNLSGTLSGYFNFVSSVLGYFPGSVVSVFSFGVTAIVIVAFFKWVFK